MKVYEMFDLFTEKKVIGGCPPIIEQCVNSSILEEYIENLNKTIAALSVVKNHAKVSTINRSFRVCSIEVNGCGNVVVNVSSEIFAHPHEGGLEKIIEKAEEEKIRAEIRIRELSLSLPPEEEEKIKYAIGAQ